MKHLILAVLAISLLGCGDDAKKSAANVSSGNTAPNNKPGNNTPGNNTPGNNTPGNNSSGASLDLGNDSDPVSSITDISGACEKTQDYFDANLSKDDLKEFGCLLSGALTAGFGEHSSDSDLQEACVQAYNGCMAEEDSNFEQESCDLEPTTCATKIGLVEECIEGQVSGIKAVIDTFACADMTLSSEPGSDLTQRPAACDQIEAECPEFFGDGE